MIIVPKFVLSNQNYVPTRKEFKLRGSQTKSSVQTYFNKSSLQAASCNPNNMQAHLFASHLKQAGYKFESDTLERLVQFQLNAHDGSWQIVHMTYPSKDKPPSTVIYGGLLKTEELEALLDM